MPPFKCHRLLKRNISKPEFLVFSPKPTLPSFLQLSWGRVNTSSCSHQKPWLLTLSLLQSYSICQKSCWLNLQNLYRILESLHFIATIVLQAVVSSYLHHRSSLRSPPASVLLSLQSSLKEAASSNLFENTSQIISLSYFKTPLSSSFHTKK